MRLNQQQIAAYHRDGFVIVRSLFSREEMSALSTFARRDKAMRDGAGIMKDGEGNESRISLWNDDKKELYGCVSYSERLVDNVALLLDDEPYHWHSKMMMKEAKVGGAWEWHQDYGYWYGDTCLFPRLASAMVAVDRAYKGNGCLEVLKGSHHIGRIDHGSVGGQAGANPERVEEAKKVCELVYVELEPGDTLFFHCNLLHASGQNRSEDPRWCMICCYNSKHNEPYRAGTLHRKYSPISKLPDSALMEKANELLAVEATAACA